ncbi:MAG TPA: hypothetical protein VNU66_04095, partial [Mycobacteriales bacterium]|nr:hypothetical protein [Mycobacteriales bacterium]
PRPSRRLPATVLAPLTVSAAAVSVGGVLLAGALGAEGVTARTVLATALLVVGLGVLVGSRWGRARGLVALAVVLALALGAATRVDAGFGSSTGDRTWVVDGSAEHRLAAGSAVLDLRPLASTERRDLDVEARVGMGELLVLVPEDLRLELDAGVGLGELVTTGADGTERTEQGTGLSRSVELGPAGARNVALDVRVGVGELEVRVVRAS